jgi:hypothetical protein
MAKKGEEVETVLNTLKGSLEDVASGKADVKEELTHIMKAAKYLKSNWKKAVPAIAAMGASAYILSLRGKGKKVVKTAAKSATGKKLAKKVTSAAGKKVGKKKSAK